MVLTFLAFLGSSTPAKSSAKTIPKRITVAHIMKTVNEVYGSKVVTSSSASATAMPLQQKLAVCSVVLSLKNGKSKEVALGKVLRCDSCSVVCFTNRDVQMLMFIFCSCTKTTAKCVASKT